ncbi:hypothetical protein [Domibacillus robiginosus]|uniref:hypothetical protein n=1 Tax=Domibacillus robiginosus TaxID=1071054 RepID=UPI00067D507C|nr:hypothetical protein [Domibacillus robiginosus]
MNTTNNIGLTQNVDISLKFGFLGLGMGGCSIAAECASVKTTDNKSLYTAVLVNTNLKDFEKIKDREKEAIHEVPLKGYEGGAGRDIEKGEQAFIENKEAVLKSIERNFSDRDFVWIVAGLGGGTGTGAVLEAIDMLYNYGFESRFGLILTLPRDNEGGNVLGNAIERMQQISTAMQAMGAILIVDNQKLYTEYINKPGNAAKSIDDFLKYCNSYVADTLHEINVVTNSFAPFGDNHFDASEFANLIQTPGFISLSKLELGTPPDLDNDSAFSNKISGAIEDGVLSDGYDFRKTERAAVSVVTNQTTAKSLFNLQFTNKMDIIMDTYAQKASEKPVATYVHPTLSGIKFYLVFAGLGLPKRIAAIQHKVIEFDESRQEEETDEVLASLSAFTRVKKEKAKPTAGSLFKKLDSSAVQSESKRDYNSLFGKK